MSKNDNRLQWRLVNWGKFINAGMGPVPSEHPDSASWHEQIVNPGDSMEDAAFIDDDDAEAVQHAMVCFMVHDIRAANVLIKFYRDGMDANGAIKADDPGLRRIRNKFWKYL